MNEYLEEFHLEPAHLASALEYAFKETGYKDLAKKINSMDDFILFKEYSYLSIILF